MDTVLTSAQELSLHNFWYKILITLLIGLLIGVERERRKHEGETSFAGIRTYPMISLLGLTAALLSQLIGPVVFVVIMVSFSGLILIEYFHVSQKGSIGGTTEISTILVFVLGALVFFELYLISAAIGIVVAVLITYKAEFRAFANEIEKEDMFATIKFAIITLIILPLLPDQTYGPLDVLNPRTIWYMVVLIAGVSFIGYVLFKLIGTKKGVQLLSILGGIASSTAVTMSFTSRSKEVPELSRNFAAGIVLASSIMFPRVLLVIFVLNKELAGSLLIPFSIFTLCGLISSLLLWRKSESHNTEQINLSNPFKIMFAIKFGAIFAVILFISKAAQVYLGESGFYFTSLFSGFADVDAIALSIANLLETSITLKVATMGIVIAALANSLSKGVITVLFGSKELKKYSIIGFSGIIGGFVVYLVMFLVL